MYQPLDRKPVDSQHATGRTALEGGAPVQCSRPSGQLYVSNTLEHLWRDNPFDRLGVLPTTDDVELRRSLDTIRMEAELGLREAGTGVDATSIGSAELLTVSEVDALALTLRDDASRFTARLLARWELDPALQTWAKSHDTALELVKAASAGRKDPVSGIASWLEFWLPGPVKPIEPLAPPDFDARRFAAETASAAVQRAFDAMPASQLGGVMTRIAGIDPLTGGYLADLGIDRIERELLTLDAEIDALPDGAAGGNLVSPFLELVDSALKVRTLATFRCAGCRAAITSQGQYCTVCGRSERVTGLERAERLDAVTCRGSLALGAKLYHADRNDAAIAVLRRALDFVSDEDARSRLDSSLDIVRLTQAREMLSKAIDTQNAGDALVWLRVIQDLTDDPDERRQAAELEAAIRSGRVLAKDTKRINRAPPLFTFWGFGVGVALDHDHIGETFSIVYCLKLLWIPFLPLTRYRVASPSESMYQFFGRLPLRPRDWAHMAIAVVATIGVVAWFATSGAAEDDSGTSPADIEAGDCVTINSTATGAYPKEVSCSASHDAYVLSAIELSDRGTLAHLQFGAQPIRCARGARSVISVRRKVRGKSVTVKSFAWTPTDERYPFAQGRISQAEESLPSHAATRRG